MQSSEPHSNSTYMDGKGQLLYLGFVGFVDNHWELLGDVTKCTWHLLEGWAILYTIFIYSIT